MDNTTDTMFGEINTGTQTADFDIIFDGELYNTHELQRELSLPRDCSTSEIFMSAYTKWQEKCVDKFDGAFAFAIWDNNKKRLFCARDKIGMKSIFYARSGENFVIASDINAILTKIPPEIDAQSIAEIILIGPGRSPGYGIFKNISELEAGHYLTLEGGKLAKHKYWDLVDRTHTDNFEQTVEHVRHLVLDSVNRRLDDNICTFLSGGLDSSIITSIAAEHFKARGLTLHSFSVDYEDNAKHFSTNKFQSERDAEYIARMREYLRKKDVKFEHHQVTLSNAQLADTLYEAVNARGLPGMADIDASLLLFCREVSKTKIASTALSGEGADEIFGGYPWYRDADIREKDGFPWSQSTEFRKLFFSKDFSYLKTTAAGYVNECYTKAIADADISQIADKSERRIKELVNLNMKWFMQTLLERQNRMSKIGGNLNIRAPFCDPRIAEYLYNVPWEYKDYNDTEKGLLRMAMRDILPDKVLWRKKSPFPKTYNPEYLGAVSKMLAKIINEPSSPLLRIANKDALSNLIALAPNIAWYGQLMNAPQIIAYFVQMDYWLRKYKIRIV